MSDLPGPPGQNAHPRLLALESLFSSPSLSSQTSNVVLGVGGVYMCPPSFPLSHLEFTAESLTLSHLLPSDLQTGNVRWFGMMQSVGFGDRAPQIQALWSDTGQVTWSFFFLLCKMGMMCLCPRIAVRINGSKFEEHSLVPGSLWQ